MRWLRSIRLALLAILAVAALPCLADEVAVLKNGFSITHHRREVVGDLTRLYLTSDGASFVDVPTVDIEHYEAAPDPPAAAQPFARASQKSVPNPAAQTAPIDLNKVVNEASGRYRLDPDFVNSVIKAESGFNVRAQSRKGAQGLMQLMPGTASQLGVSNAFDPQSNVDGGTRYLRELLERYDFDMVKALAAYNAGPQRVEHFGGVPPYSETRAYVARIVRDFNKKKTAKEKSSARNALATTKTTTPKKATHPATGKAAPATASTEANASSPSLNQ